MAPIPACAHLCLPAHFFHLFPPESGSSSSRVSADGETLLFPAVATGSVELVSLLLRSGAIDILRRNLEGM